MVNKKEIEVELDLRNVSKSDDLWHDEHGVCYTGKSSAKENSCWSSSCDLYGNEALTDFKPPSWADGFIYLGNDNHGCAANLKRHRWIGPKSRYNYVEDGNKEQIPCPQTEQGSLVDAKYTSSSTSANIKCTYDIDKHSIDDFDSNIITTAGSYDEIKFKLEEFFMQGYCVKDGNEKVPGCGEWTSKIRDELQDECAESSYFKNNKEDCKKLRNWGDDAKWDESINKYCKAHPEDPECSCVNASVLLENGEPYCSDDDNAGRAGCETIYNRWQTYKALKEIGDVLDDQQEETMKEYILGVCSRPTCESSSANILKYIEDPASCTQNNQFCTIGNINIEDVTVQGEVQEMLNSSCDQVMDIGGGSAGEGGSAGGTDDEVLPGFLEQQILNTYPDATEEEIEEKKKIIIGVILSIIIVVLYMSFR